MIPGALPKDEQTQPLAQWNQTNADIPLDKCVHQLFEEQVERTPDAVAIVFENSHLTYRELNTRANQLAHHLISLGVKPDIRVGICVERSLEMIVGILGIIKAGGAYVPLDPSYPQDRLAFMLNDAQVLSLLTQGHLAKHLPKHEGQLIFLDTDWQTIGQQNGDNPIGKTRPNNLAYVLYTSGSTGSPKGVCCKHAGLINLLADFDRKQPLSVGDKCSLWTILSFDVSIYEIFSPLLAAGTLSIVPEQVRSDTITFIEWLNFQQIKSAYIPPFMLNYFSSWLKKATEKPRLKRLLVGVEPIQEQLLVSIKKQIEGLQIINGYGPTETTICAVLYVVPSECSHNNKTPIGLPVQNIEIYLLNEQMQVVPVGTTGEMYIGGVGLAQGYLNRPELTAKKFIQNPFSHDSDSRLYKTGDLARYLPDGNLEFVGRIDHQVKIRGYRIELGEIEAKLHQYPNISDAVVLARTCLAINDSWLISLSPNYRHNGYSCVVKAKLNVCLEMTRLIPQQKSPHLIFRMGAWVYRAYPA